MLLPAAEHTLGMSAAPDRPEKDKISYSFPKEERLHHKKLIAELFSKGSSFNLYPLRFVLLKQAAPQSTAPQILVSVSKKHFKKAVDRNRIKRQLREAYRLNKHLLQNEAGCTVLALGILYIAKEKNPFEIIQKKLISGLDRCLSN